MTELKPRKPATSDALRTPRHLAESMRRVAADFRGRAADEVVLSPEAVACFALLFETWAEALAPLGELDGRTDPSRRPDLSDAYPVSEALLLMADLLAGEISLGDGLFVDFATGETMIASLRRLARRAAELQIAAQGFRFVAGEDLPPPPPEAVVPHVTTGAGEHVTYALLARMAAKRGGDARKGELTAAPCDVEQGGTP